MKKIKLMFVLTLCTVSAISFAAQDTEKIERQLYQQDFGNDNSNIDIAELYSRCLERANNKQEMEFPCLIATMAAFEKIENASKQNRKS